MKPKKKVKKIKNKKKTEKVITPVAWVYNRGGKIICS
jgi:hypothetical protein